MVAGKTVKEEKDEDSLEVLQQCKTTSLMANSTVEQGSTLRDLLTTTAGKLKLGSTDAGIAFAPVYSTASQVNIFVSEDFIIELIQHLLTKVRHPEGVILPQFGSYAEQCLGTSYQQCAHTAKFN